MLGALLPQLIRSAFFFRPLVSQGCLSCLVCAVFGHRPTATNHLAWVTQLGLVRQGLLASRRCATVWLVERRSVSADGRLLGCVLLRHVNVVCGYIVTRMGVLLRASANAGLLLLSLRVVLGITYQGLLLVCVGIRAWVLRSNRSVTYLGLLRVGVASVGMLPRGCLPADLALLGVVRVGPKLLLVT